MGPTDIKILLLRRGLTITALADKLGCRRQELSYTIHGNRVYPSLRKRLAAELGIDMDAMFPPKAAARSSQCSSQ
jgi:transcriptional regulator with XRE-family HTH domain